MSKVVRVKSRFLQLTTLMVGALLLLTAIAFADTVQISPYKIILNAQGQSEDVLAIMPMSITSGYYLTSGEATLSFNGEVVSETISMRYCYIDDNLLISFDRAALLSNPAVIALAGNTVTATVEGSFLATNSDGETYTRDFYASDLVEILAPGKAGDNAK